MVFIEDSIKTLFMDINKEDVIRTHYHCKQQIIWEGFFYVFFRSISLGNGLDGPLSDSLFLYSPFALKQLKVLK